MPQAILDLLGWRTNGKPNIADGASNPSVNIAEAVFRELGVTGSTTASGQTAGSRFEAAIRRVMADRLSHLDPSRDWDVGSREITQFAQYAHLARIKEIAEHDPTLRSSLGTDYLIKPDITIGIATGARRHLHAAVSCKWTIRSDRVQNIRHEGVVLTRHRRAANHTSSPLQQNHSPRGSLPSPEGQANWIVSTT